MATILRLSRLRVWLIPAVLLLSPGCGHDAGQPALQFGASAGQVKPVTSSPVTPYAAARFADQVSFGATPALVADIRAKGFERWIDEQFALPPSLIDISPIVQYDSQVPEQGDVAYRYSVSAQFSAFLTASDQLRRRVSWSLSQFIVASIAKVEPYGGLAYSNFLQVHAFGNYGDLIRAVTMNPSMGVYLDNLENRPTSDECPWCAPNENYARELLQLFTLGVVKLNLDGSVQRDADGKPIETYSQKDVEELARALTGWRIKGNFHHTDYRRYDGELVPDSRRGAHDRGAKVVLGHAFPTGGGARQELDTIVSVLMSHQNIAPFVSLRLIQHLVTSDPSQAYVARVATVFRNNGQGVAGDMKAVVKAILLDPEARRGDQPGNDTRQSGKMREPLLWYTGLLRGLGCRQTLTWSNGVSLMLPASQRPFEAPSVFSYYLPTDRAPGSNLLAPEQRLLTSEEFSWRLAGFAGGVKRAGEGCAAAAFGRAFSISPAAFADLASERFFRGAMPASLRRELIALAPVIRGDTPDDKAINLLLSALLTPYYGVIR